MTDFHLRKIRLSTERSYPLTSTLHPDVQEHNAIKLA